MIDIGWMKDGAVFALGVFLIGMVISVVAIAYQEIKRKIEGDDDR